MSLRTLVLTCAIVICVPSVASGDDAPPPGVTLLPRPDTVLVTGFGVIRMPNGFDYFVPQGSHILQPEAYSELDLEMKRLQDAETRLLAENRSMRETASSWQPGWKTLTLTFVAGLVGGAYIYSKL